MQRSRQGIRQMARGAVMVAVAGALLAGLSGCATTIHDHRGYVVDPLLTDAIQPGIDNKLSVERSLGRPSFVSEFGEPAWYYVSINTRQKPFARPRTTDQTVMRIRFDPAGNVLAVDRAGAEKVVNLDPTGKKTPTLGRDRGFFEDLFGNIGTVGAPGMGSGNAPAPGGGPNGS
jgi:outer membrane protein assembly factor BamE (lipoprotein component of BamABCDE complex)